MTLSPSVLALPGPFSHELIHTHGTRLHVATAGNPRAHLVILLHDALGGWFDYLSTIPLLADEFHVAAVSTRGFGQSDKPPAGYSIRHAVGDISGLIRALGHGKATVVAHGSAARIATTLAANYPRRVSNVILLAPLSRSTPLRSSVELGLTRLATRFPSWTAAKSLAGMSAHDNARELRSLSYQIGGTKSPRIQHAKLSFSPLPMNWSSTFSQPLRTSAHALHLTAAQECADVIARGQTT